MNNPSFSETFLVNLVVFVLIMLVMMLIAYLLGKSKGKSSDEHGQQYESEDPHDEIKLWKFSQDALKKQRIFKRLGKVLRRALFNLLPRLIKNKKRAIV